MKNQKYKKSICEYFIRGEINSNNERLMLPIQIMKKLLKSNGRNVLI